MKNDEKAPWLADWWVDSWGRVHGQIFDHPQFKHGALLKGNIITAIEIEGTRVELEGPSEYWASTHPTWTIANVMKEEDENAG